MREQIKSGRDRSENSFRVTGKRRRRGSAVALASSAAAAGAFALLAGSANPARAATKTWTFGGSSNWSTGTNWSGSTVPAPTGDTINITDNAAGVKTVTFDGAVTTTSAVALTVGGTAATFTGQMTLAFPAGSVKT